MGVIAYKEAMDVGEEDGQLAARPEQLGILYGGHEVAAVRTPGCGAGSRSIVSSCIIEVACWPPGKWRAVVVVVSRHVYCRLPMEPLRPEAKDQAHSRSPVNLRILPIVDDLLNNVEVERLGQILLDQGDPFLGGHRCHGGQVLPGQDGRTRGRRGSRIQRLSWLRTSPWDSGWVDRLARVES